MASNLPVFCLQVEAEVRNPRSYTPADGPNAGKTYYSGTAELATPGAMWSTMRISVRSRVPVLAGVHRLNLVSVDNYKGVAVAEIVEGK